jgi:hypothetical protein
MGSKNKKDKDLLPEYYLSSDKRVTLLANIIVDRILGLQDEKPVG